MFSKSLIHNSLKPITDVNTISFMMSMIYEQKLNEYKKRQQEMTSLMALMWILIRQA